jgi:hypothetical protein
MRRVGTVNAMQGSGVTSGCSTCMLIAPRWLGSYEDNAEKVRSVGDSCAVCGRSINEVGTSGRRSDSFHLIFSTVCNCRCHNASRCRCGRRYQRCPFHAKVLTRTRPLRPCHHAGNAWSVTTPSPVAGSHRRHVDPPQPLGFRHDTACSVCAVCVCAFDTSRSS